MTFDPATLTLAVFVTVYVGMILGRLPFLQLDRTGIVLLGAIALVAGGSVDLETALASVDFPTIVLLFALMVVSAQLRLGGFYGRITRALALLEQPPAILLGLIMAAVGTLSAIFSNDVVCLAVAPVLIDVCRQRRLDPMPFLLGLACAANLGSAATLIGNPQNMLIGQVLHLPFASYAALATPPVVLSLAAAWGILVARQDRRWSLGADDPEPIEREEPADSVPGFDPWQTAKGLTVACALLVAFLATSWPRDVAALAGAGILLTSRKLHSRSMLGLVDWQLLAFFAGLFVIQGAMESAGLAHRWVETTGLPLERPAWLFGATVVLSNLVSNVPSVMLLLPFADGGPGGAILALASTFAGNFLLVGSIANLIVADVATSRGIALDAHRHARAGVPVAAASLAIAAVWLALAS